jgi:hypothetical protein
MLYARLSEKQPWHKLRIVSYKPMIVDGIVGTQRTVMLSCQLTGRTYQGGYFVSDFKDVVAFESKVPRRNRCKRCWPRRKCRATQKKFNRACAPIIAMRDEQDR